LAHDSGFWGADVHNRQATSGDIQRALSQLSAMLGDIRLRQATGWSFRGLLEHLATLTRNQVRYTGTQVTIPMLTEPTSTQRQAFNLLGAAIPLTLK
jgi:hypothetical protein